MLLLMFDCFLLQENILATYSLVDLVLLIVIISLRNTRDLPVHQRKWSVRTMICGGCSTDSGRATSQLVVRSVRGFVLLRLKTIVESQV